MRNDTSFLISDIMSVYEAQSTFNPNLPLRLLGYVDELYSGYISRNKLNKYGSKLISLPIPKLVVFYNGQTDKMDETIIKLSDSFNESHRAEADIEVKVRMLNVNHGRNCELMEKCKPLQSMPDDFVIKIFLVGHMKEVEGMLDREYKEEEVKELFKREGREEGKEEGREETIVTQICKKLVKGKSVSEIADAIEEPEEYVSKVCEIASKYLPNYDVHIIMSEL